MQIAINGFGRIGRTFLRALMLNSEARKKIEIVAINIGPAPLDQTAHLLKYDSTFGTLPFSISQSGTTLTIDNQQIQLFTERDPAALPWKSLSIDWVVEASGFFRTKALASKHITAGARNVLISAPSPDADQTIIPGINSETYNPSLPITSLGSCTTNCLAPLIKVLHSSLTITSAQMTTVHAYTNDQSLLDGAHKDFRRARSAACNIIPASTGADKLITQIFPDLKNKIRGLSLRVPTPNVSLIDLAFTTEKNTTAEEINKLFHDAAHGSLVNILDYTTEQLVSTDFIANPASAIVDSQLTTTTNSVHKVVAWYDNEFGYSCRLVDFLGMVV